MTYINLESKVNVNGATYAASDITNYGNINLAGANFSGDVENAGKITIGGESTLAGTVTNTESGSVVIASGENTITGLDLTGDLTIEEDGQWKDLHRSFCRRQGIWQHPFQMYPFCPNIFSLQF